MATKKKKSASGKGAKRPSKRKASGGASKKAQRGAPKKKASGKRKSASGSTRKKAARASDAPAAAANRLDLRDLGAIEQLMNIMGSTDVLELELQDGADQRLRLSRRGSDAPVQYAAPMHAAPAPAQAPAPAAAAEAAGSDGDAESSERDSADEFVSPMVGTFYRAPTPGGRRPTWCNGDSVTGRLHVICIIEAMKVFNEIKRRGRPA